MQISDRRVALIHYTLTNDHGEALDSSIGGEPLAYLHGMGNLVPGLEKNLLGKRAGDMLKVKVPPAEGYGPRDEKLIQQVPRRAFQNVRDVKPGMRFNSQGHSVIVTRVLGDMVTVDGNHALAGETLNFEVEVIQVREATGEELAHGHVHGPGGHHH